MKRSSIINNKNYRRDIVMVEMLFMTVVNSTDYYTISPLDKNQLLRLTQYFLFVFAALYTGIFNIRIAFLLRKYHKLQNSSNLIIYVILFFDLFIVIQYSVTAVWVTATEELFLTESLARFIVFLNLFTAGTQRYLLALASVERLFYFIYVYKHYHAFNNRRTCQYMVIIIIFSFISSLWSTLTNAVVFLPDMMTCHVFYGSFKEADVLSKISVVFRLTTEIGIFLFMFGLQFTTFIFSYSTARADKTLCKNGHVWKRMIRNFISLFSVSVLICLGAVFLKLSYDLYAYPIFVRISVILYIFGSPILDPLIILLGNPPLKRAFLQKKKQFVTNFSPAD